MEQYSIDLKKLFTYSYQQFKKYSTFIVGAVLTLLIVGMLPQVYFFINAPKNPTVATQFTSFGILLLQTFLTLGFTKIMLLLAEDKHTQTMDMFNNFKPFVSYFVASFLYRFAAALGLLLFIVPGIIVLIRFQFFPYLIIEDPNKSAFSALRESYELTRDLSVELFLLGATILIANIAGFLLFGVGILFTYPITTIATAVVYKDLLKDISKIPSEEFGG